MSMELTASQPFFQNSWVVLLAFEAKFLTLPRAENYRSQVADLFAARDQVVLRVLIFPQSLSM